MNRCSDAVPCLLYTVGIFNCVIFFLNLFHPLCTRHCFFKEIFLILTVVWSRMGRMRVGGGGIPISVPIACIYQFVCDTVPLKKSSSFWQLVEVGWGGWGLGGFLYLSLLHAFTRRAGAGGRGRYCQPLQQFSRTYGTILNPEVIKAKHLRANSFPVTLLMLYFLYAVLTRGQKFIRPKR
jgi:hypothetical protein